MQVKADLDPMTRDMDCWGFERNLVRIMKNIDICLSKLYMNFKFILDYSPLNADPLFPVRSAIARAHETHKKTHQ